MCAPNGTSESLGRACVILTNAGQGRPGSTGLVSVRPDGCPVEDSLVTGRTGCDARPLTVDGAWDIVSSGQSKGVRVAIRVIGAGFGRTGTASLKLALDQLGFGPSYHMSEVMADPGAVPLWERAAEGHPDWDTILDGYQSTTDFPACTYWRELMEHYPDAKVILTVRDAESWYESVHATIMSRALVEHLRQAPVATMFETSVFSHFGDGIHDRSAMVDAYERHVATVVATVPSDRLLAFDVKQGWQPLCDFLEVPVPDDPFPRANSRAETEALVATVLAIRPDDETYGDQLGQHRHRLFTESES
jgi:hypothetical protein